MSSPLVSKSNITDYIPQRQPIIMVDNLVSCEENKVVTDFYIREDELFVMNGQLTESGLLENIAQTAAAKVGYECHIREIPVPLGFIGGINKVQIHQLPKIGQTIKTIVDIDKIVFGVTIIKANSYANDQPLISCEMKIVIEDQQS